MVKELVLIMAGGGTVAALLKFFEFLIQHINHKKERAEDKEENDIRKELKDHLTNVNNQWKLDYCDVNAKAIADLAKEVREGLADREAKGAERYQEHKESIEELRKAMITMAENTEETRKIGGYLGESLMALTHDNLLVELRTKAAVQVTDNIPNIIYAFTVSPEDVVGRFEKYTAPVSARISAAAKAIANGAKVRLCFDPIIKIPEWKEAYKKLIDECSAQIDFQKLTDVSVGTFRISADYLNKMRRAYPDSKTAWYPYVIKDGVAQYEPETDKAMQEYVCALLEKHIGREKIFTWN